MSAEGFVAAVAVLKQQVWGEVLLPSDGAAWDGVLKTWSLPVKPVVPAVAVRPRGIPDIRRALAFAQTHGLNIAVKGGGHHAAGLGLVDGGLVLDMSGMRGVIVDPKGKTATAQGGALLGDVDQATSVYNLAVPLGYAPTTGMGLALAGGIGVLKRVYGPTAQHIIAATVVLADGSVVRTDSESDPELLWGLRGAGAALGVVAELTFRLHDVSSAYAGVLVIPDDPQHNNFRAIARFMRDVGLSKPGYSNDLIRAFPPGGPPMMMLMIAFLGPKSSEEKAAFIAPLRALGPVKDTVGKGTYLDMQMAHLAMTRALPPQYEYQLSGLHHAHKVTDAFLDTWCQLLDQWPDSHKPRSLAAFDTWKAAPGGTLAASAEEEEGTGPHGLSSDGAEMAWLFGVPFQDASQFDDVKAFAHKMKSKLEALGSQADSYANLTLGPAASEAALAARVGGEAKLARLRALKARIDPDNVFKSHPFKGL